MIIFSSSKMFRIHCCVLHNEKFMTLTILRSSVILSSKQGTNF